METATQTSGAASPSAAPPYDEISIGLLREARLNPRQHFDPQKFAELKESIRRNGIITPLVVRARASTADFYHIAAGHRRYRAAKELGLKTAPCRIRVMSDEEFLEVLTIENCQREDVHPLEEGEGFRKLLKLEKYTPELIAEKISKEVGYVYRRLQLAALAEPVKKAFLEGKGGFGISHAVLLARVSEADQCRALKETVFTQAQDYKNGHYVDLPPKVASTSNIDAWLRRNVFLDLGTAPWDKADATMKAGACTVCPKRTGANAHLFDDFKPGDERCTDRACYHAKEKEFVQIALRKAVESGEKLLKMTGGYCRSGKPKDVIDPTEGGTEVDGKSCPNQERAIVTMAAQGHYHSPYALGTIHKLCRKRTCPVHHPTLSSSAKPSAAEKRRSEDQKLKRESQQAGRVALLEQVLRTSSTLKPDQYRRLIALELTDIIRYDADDSDLEWLGRILDVKVEPAPGKKGRMQKHQDQADRFADACLKACTPTMLLCLALYRAVPAVPDHLPKSMQRENALDTAARYLGIDAIAIMNREASKLRAAAKQAKATKPAEPAKKKGAKRNG